MTLALITSHDGLWAAVRRDREVAILGHGLLPEVAKLTLEDAATEIALVGPPATLVTVGPTPVLAVYQLPGLDASTKVELDQPYAIAAATGARLALVSADGKSVLVARTAGRAVTTQVVEVGSALEFAVGLDKQQFLFALHRKLEVWDAASGRPLLRLQLQLPPPPRMVGAALGHLWVTRPNGSEVFVYRLSDGRPFRHDAGIEIERVICHPASPMIVLVTRAGLVRLHCFAHSLLAIEAPPEARTSELALLAPDADNVMLLGIDAATAEPWRIPLGATAPPLPLPLPLPLPGASVPAIAPESGTVKREWREPLATYGAALANGETVEAPVFGLDTELGALAHLCNLGLAARKTLGGLYALYLTGETWPLARAAKAFDWAEVLGRGELGALAMIDKRDGRVRLHPAVTELLDGCPPRAVRLAGGGAPALRTGAFRLGRDGRSDAELEQQLAGELGKIAIATTDDLDAALLEARLHGATCIALAVPHARPSRWPRDAGLVLVLYGAPTSWVADLPQLAIAVAATAS